MERQRKHTDADSIEGRGHAIGMTRKQEVEDEFEVQWSVFVLFSHVNIFSLEATVWHA